MARTYLWLQEEGKVPNGFSTKLVIKLRTEVAENSTSFIFNEKALIQYFKDHPDQLPKDAKDVPTYNFMSDKRD